MMPDLGEIIGQKQRQLAMAAEKAARLNDVLSRPDEDFIVYRRSGARGIATMMRPARCPGWLWTICRAAAPIFLNVGFGDDIDG